MLENSPKNDGLREPPVSEKEQMDEISRTKRGSYSKNGCYNCKRMKLKCTEGKPACERCNRTKRKCLYPAEFGSINLMENKLSSPAKQLNLNMFQLRLFKFYIDFNHGFFGALNNRQWQSVWAEAVPIKFGQDSLVKTSVYTMSAMKLWRCYDANNLRNVKLMEGKGVIDLIQETDRLLDRLLLQTARVKFSEDMSVEECGSFVVANGIVYSVVCLHPNPIFKLFDFDTSRESRFDLVTILQQIACVAPLIKKKLNGTIYEHIYAQKTVDSESEIGLRLKDALKYMSIPPIDYLTTYVQNKVHDHVEANHYVDVLQRLRKTVAVCFAMGHFLPMNLFLPQTACWARGPSEDFFWNKVVEKNYTALKILYYICIFKSYGRFKIDRDTFVGIWDNYCMDYLMHYGHIDQYDSYVFQLRHQSKSLDPMWIWLKQYGDIDKHRSDT